MPKNTNFGELALDMLTIKEKKEKLRAQIKAKEAALNKKNRDIKEKFNIARVRATMSVASTVFSALGVDIYTSLNAALKDPKNIERLNKSGSFDVLFEDEQKLLSAVAMFLNEREDIRMKILEFVERERNHVRAIAAGNSNNGDKADAN